MSTDRTDDVDALLEVEALALEWVKLADERSSIDERLEAIKAQLLAALEHGTHQAGPYRVQVKSAPRRLNTTRLQQAFPVTQHPELYSARVDTAAVKAHIAGVVLDDFYDEGRPQVVIA